MQKRMRWNFFRKVELNKNTTKHSDDMGISKKEQPSLLDFKLEISVCLYVESVPEIKRKGRLSIKTQLNMKRRKCSVPVPKAINTCSQIK